MSTESVKVTDAAFHESKLQHIAHFGIRLALGVIFIVHGIGKLDPMFGGFLSQIGLPSEMQIPIALAEIVPGMLVMCGVLSRISSSLLSIVLLGAIFYVKKASGLTGQTGVELELILLAANLAVIVTGPGKISVSHLAKKLPRFLH
ncbi:MAG: DoxX family protein [Candidatus Nitrosotenuis sp.]